MHPGILINANKCFGCNACTIICKQRHGTAPGHMWCRVYEREIGEYPNAHRAWIPLLCMHCENAPCERACPTGASHYAEDGTVQIDFDKCIGCRMCMGACPYNARFFNKASIEENCYFPGKGLSAVEELHKDEHIRGVMEKCTMCSDRRADGLEPACVQTCPPKARMFGDLDDPDSDISKEIKRLAAKPLYEEYGTKPSVYYVGVE